MSEKDKNRIAEKMSEFILLMGYNADFQVVIAKELNRQIWLSSENLCRKQCRELLYLLYMADSATLLSFTVSLGRLVWRSYLRGKRKILKQKLSNRINKRERERKKRKGKSGMVVVLARRRRGGVVYSRKANARFERYTIGFLMRLRLVYRVARRARSKKNVKVGSRVYRLGLAMGFLSFRNVCVTSEWEFFAVCLVQQVFGFWRSISIGGELDGSFVGVAQKFGLDVVSGERLDRLQSCLRCSSTTRYQGYG
ncbi:uncharacterized protein LOC141591532 [Silene latifolia]|uniref:uncharacterized protein LOC141591532 n=1 Tax=Silene latifolia TaxID=37657 RepID=UPI003D77D40B